MSGTHVGKGWRYYIGCILCVWACLAGQVGPVAAQDAQDAKDTSEASGASAASPPEGAVRLNFEGADIREVVHSLAAALGIHYTIDPRVQGQVTIRTASEIPRRDLFPVFHQILRSHGVAANRVGNIYHIGPVGEAKTKTPSPRSQAESPARNAEDPFVIELVKVEHISAEEMANILQPFVAPGGDVLAYPRANLVVISDLASSVRRLREMVGIFDTDTFRDLHARIYRLEHANVDDLGQELYSILEPYGVLAASLESLGVFVVPLVRLNSIVVICFNTQVFTQVEKWIQVLDVPPEKGGGRTVHVYAVENAKAYDLAGILADLYGDGGGGSRSDGSGFGSRGSTGSSRGGFVGGGSRSGGSGTSSRGSGSSSRSSSSRSSGISSSRGGSSGSSSRSSGSSRSTSSRGSSSSGSSSRSGGSGSSTSSRGSSSGGDSRGVVLGGGFGGGGGGAQSVLIAPQEGEKPIFKEEVRIVADEVTNSLVILATPRDYAMIRDVLRKLDIVPRQVLIEAMIAEVQLVGDLAFGLEYALSQGGLEGLLGTSTAEDGTTTSGSGVGAGDLGSAGSLSIGNNALLGASRRAVNIGAQGLFGFLTDRDNFLVMINALASKDRVNILATPHVMAADNREAHILIGEEIPILTSTSTSSLTDSARTVNSIQYRDTGRILTILPQVNSAGLVNLEIRQEVSAVGQEEFGRTNSPSFVSREAETTVVVQDGESVVLGGIIDEQTRRTRSGVPYLMNAPILGRLFRVDSERTERTELIILITPHVIRNRQELHDVTSEFSGRIRNLKKMLQNRTLRQSGQDEQDEQDAQNGQAAQNEQAASSQPPEPVEPVSSAE